MKIKILLFLLTISLSSCFPWNTKTSQQDNLDTPLVKTGEATRIEHFPVVTPSATIMVHPNTLMSHPTQTSTRFPVATPTMDDKMSRIDVLSGGMGCELPCWLGLTPGVSPFDDISPFAAKLGLEFHENLYQKVDGTAILDITDSDNNKNEKAISVYINWKKGIVSSIIIQQHFLNDNSAFLRVERLQNQVGSPDQIYLWGPYGKWMGFILDYSREGFIFALNSVTTKQATICLGDSLKEKELIIELYDPKQQVDVGSQVNLFGDFVWKTQADSGYSVNEILDRIVKKECLSPHDFTNQW